MSPQLLRQVCLAMAIVLAGALGVRAQSAQPPAYLAVVTGEATLERGGEAEPATQNMPFVAGDRLRTAAGRVEIVFPDGSAIEVGEDSEVEAVSATRVRLIAGTMDHIQRQTTSSQSATYLPQDLQTYGSTFDQYGSWQYDSPHGYVWYPAVGADWRPYSYGSWAPIRSYGWTWIGLDPWAWPTHHYGRWGFARDAWFWIPGRTWGAAWVSWSFADDYVSWCPLGYDSRAVFALSIGSRRGWDHWTVPRRTFETRGYGRDYASYYRGGARESTVGRREPFSGNRTVRSPLNERTTNADRRSAADYRRPQAGANLPPASGGAIAVPRAGTRDSAGSRDSGFGTRSRPTTTGARPTTDARPTADYRRPTTDYRRPTTDSRQPATDSRERVYLPAPSYRAREQSPRPAYTPPPQTSMPGASGGAVAAPRVEPHGSVGIRDSGFGNRPAVVDGRDRRQTTDYRRPTTDSRPPTTDSRRREAPAASGGAPAPRSVPHERAAPSGGDARPRAQERSGQGQGRRR